MTSTTMAASTSAHIVCLHQCGGAGSWPRSSTLGARPPRCRRRTTSTIVSGWWTPQATRTATS
eukprot:4242443-Pyramimonas_sp.AAC.1